MATITITDSSPFTTGESFQQKLDSFIANNSVVMISKGTCPYCNAVKDLLVNDLGLQVQSIELNKFENADHVKEIQAYMKEKAGSTTVPKVFVEGKYIGDHDALMAMDSKGDLEPKVKMFMKGPRNPHAAKASASSNSTGYSGPQPLFWYPPKVNKWAVKSTGILTCGLSAISTALLFGSPQNYKQGGFLAAAMLGDFTLRLLAGSKFSPVSKCGAAVVKNKEPLPRPGAPKQFASFCGVMFTGMGTLCSLLLKKPSVGGVFMGILTVCAGMEGFLDFCLGCKFFAWGEMLFAGKPTKTA